jgi:hypothetical protein
MVYELHNEFGQEHIFESGTLEGLMKAMSENNGTSLGIYDEFATFLDGLDKGANSTFERSRYLSLFNGSTWSKKTKTSGSLILKDPRFNLLSFTQPYSLISFARQSNRDGFFQRFLITCPKEVYVRIEEKESTIDKSCDVMDMYKVLAEIYNTSCATKTTTLKLSDEAMEIYRIAHDENVDYREKELFKEELLSIKIKSLGHLLRVAGVINRLREANSKCLDEIYEYKDVVSGEDMFMARNLVQYSVQTSMLCIGGSTVSDVAPCVSFNLKKSNIPDPKNMSVEFLVHHSRFVQRIVSEEITPLARISRDNIYPTINGEKNAGAARRFVNGLCEIGLGEMKEVMNKKGVKQLCFKRFHPYQRCGGEENNPEKENLLSLWKRLNLKFPLNENSFSCSQPSPSVFTIL